MDSGGSRRGAQGVYAPPTPIVFSYTLQFKIIYIEAPSKILAQLTNISFSTILICHHKKIIDHIFFFM